MNIQNSQELLLKANDRGLTQIDWLTSYHSFSFGDYYNPAFKGFKSLRVINEDFIQAKTGFGTHPHANMEILTYILRGAVEHRDTMNNHTIIKAGEVQLMSAGSGIAHSEFNPLDEELHLLQIWVHCLDRDKEPNYEQKSLSEMKAVDGVRLLCSKTSREGSLVINQNIEIFEISFTDDQSKDLSNLVHGNAFYLHNIDAEISANNHDLKSGDAIAVEQAQELKLSSQKSGRCLLFVFQ